MGTTIKHVTTSSKWPRNGREVSLSAIRIFLISSLILVGCSESKKKGSLTRPVTAPTPVVVVDPTPLSAPVISVPSSNPYAANNITLAISGTCITGATVHLEGDTTDSVVCTSSAFSFTVSKPADATYNFTVRQQSNSVNTSPAVAVQWVRDTLAPSAPVITSPAASPEISADNSLDLLGNCEDGATVNISGDHTDSLVCNSGAFGFTIAKGVDGTYNFSVSQTDAVGNVSNSASFQWQRNSTLPATPVLSSPASSPIYTNGNSLVISGSCVTGNAVNLSGSDTQSATCASSSFSFTVNKASDASYSFSVVQVDAGNSLSSGSATAVWNRDTVNPSAPTITSPASSPVRNNQSSITISGACESNATVNISGSATQSTTCASSAYSITINNSSDGSYTYNVSQTDRAGNSSGSLAQAWVRDTVVPSAPTITSPASSPLRNNASSITVSGACENNATVAISGDSTNTVTCTSSAYSFVVNKSSDATYNFSVAQTDIAGNGSTSTSTQWIRDTVAPSAPTITSPASNPYTSADTTFAVSGACESGATVNLAGDLTGSTSCSSGSYSINITKNSDATYNFSFTQTDVAGNTSASTAFQWTRSSSIPATPTISAPASTPFYSNQGSVVISGTCTDGFAVELSGSDTQSATCASSAYSFTVNKASDATYSFSIVQKNLSNISSAAASQQWIRDTASPSAPTISSPAASPYYSNGSSVVLSGACETNTTVALSGDATASTTCASSAYSFTVNKSADATYNFSIRQTDLAGNNSSFSTKQWVRDTVAPLAPTVTSPATTPYTAQGNLVVSGSCIDGYTVSLQEYTNAGHVATSGSPQTATCASSSFSFTVSKTVDMTYYIGVKQVDLASNSSSEANVEWIRDSSLMTTPSLTYNSSAVTGPITTNGNSITVRASCTLGSTVSINTSATNVTPGTSILCSAQTYGDFTISESADGTYNYDFWQEDTTAGTFSASNTFTWVRDTSAPAAPVITNPSTSPFTAPGNLTLSGTCETGATVNLSGDSTSSTSCSGGLFSFSISKSSDATYNFSVTQTDAATNVSGSDTQQWVRDSNSVPPPTISSPVANVTNNANSLTVSGICNDGYLLTISGYGSGTLSSPGTNTQTCNGGSFSWTITLASDATLNLSLKQTFNSTDSAASTRTWIRDTVAPTVTFSAVPADPNLQSIVSWTFSANETVSGFECKLDSGSYAPCTSPYTPASIANGAHTLYVRATDTAGNISSDATDSWSQEAYNAIAIYSLDSADPLVNDSSYSSTYEGTLTATGAPSNITSGKFGQGRQFSSGNYYSTTDHGAHDVITKAISVEGYWQSNAGIPGAVDGTAYTLVSKNGNSSGSYGWEVQLVKVSGSNVNNTKCKLRILLTTNNTSVPTAITSGTQFTCAKSTSTWNYFAVTWSAAGAGAIRFYGTPSNSTTFTSYGSGAFGNASTLLSTNNANLSIGAGGVGTPYIGGLDEVRISQTARSITAVPTTAFSAD